MAVWQVNDYTSLHSGKELKAKQPLFGIHEVKKIQATERDEISGRRYGMRRDKC